MSKPEFYTARELAEALASYGDMRIGAAVVNADDEQDGPHLRLRLETTRLGDSNVLAITGYAPHWGDSTEDEDDDEQG